MTDIHNIAGYHFTALTDCDALRQHFLSVGGSLGLRGSIILSPEGINLALSATRAAMAQFIQQLRQDQRFSDMPLKDSYSTTLIFRRLIIKIKPEIITMRTPDIAPAHTTAKHLAPHTLKAWLDAGKELLLLDTRNDYEIALGQFAHAHSLGLQHFSEFPEKLANLTAQDKQKTIVTYCTGGIRCEKASAYMLQQGFDDVYQLDGGILEYFAQCGNSHYQGECFVFDKRVAVDHQLNPSTSETVQQLDC